MPSRALILTSALVGLNLIGLNALMRRNRMRQLSILMFHGFMDCEPAGLENSGGVHLHIDQFDAVCRRLARKYSVIALDEAVEMIRSGRVLPRRSLCLTFDDGYASNLNLALPVLKKYGLPATVFLATDFVHNGVHLWPDRLEYAIGRTAAERLSTTIDGTTIDWPLTSPDEKRAAMAALGVRLKEMPQEHLYEEVAALERTLGCALADDPSPPQIYCPLTWEGARRMVASGLVTIGAHSHRHRILGRCRLETASEEVELSTRLIREHTGVRPVLFAYPNGKSGDFTAQTRQILLRHSYRGAVTTEHGLNVTGSATDPLCMKRFGGAPCPWYAEALTAGTIDFIKRVLGGWRAFLGRWSHRGSGERNVLMSNRPGA